MTATELGRTVEGDELQASGLRSSAARGVRWTTAATVGRQVGNVGISVVLARLLGARNYGIVGQATVYILLLSFLVDGGFSTAFIQKPTVDDADEGSVWWYSLASTAALVTLSLLIAPLLATFFHTPQLSAVVRVLAFDVLFLGLAIAPTAIVTRRLQFRALAIAQVVGTVVGGVAGIVAAELGARYWALVVFVCLQDFLCLVIVAVAAGRPRLRFSWSSIRGMGAFGANVIGTQILYYAMRNSDNILVGRYLGATSLGLYALSYRVLPLPQQTLGYMVNRVSLPVFSRLQDDRPRLGRYFLKATRMIAFATFPAMALVFVGARRGVPVVFGRHWRHAIIPMQVLAVAGLMASVQHLTRPLLYATGRHKLALRVQIALTASSIGAFAVGLRWGILGVAGAVCAVMSVFGPLLAHYVGREVEMSLLDYAKALTPAITGCLPLVAAFQATMVVTSPVPTMLPRLALASLAGIGTYAAAMRLLFPAAFREGMETVVLFGRGGRLATALGPRRGQVPRQPASPVG